MKSRLQFGIEDDIIGNSLRTIKFSIHFIQNYSKGMWVPSTKAKYRLAVWMVYLFFNSFFCQVNNFINEDNIHKKQSKEK